MVSGDGRTITWDLENRPLSVTKDSVTTTYVYDGDGQRVKKTVGEETTVYINQYYEKTGTEVTTHYYLGGKLIAVKKDTVLSYIHQDHMGSTSVISDTNGSATATLQYLPFGAQRAPTSTLPTDKLFTGQRLDDNTGLYYYNARYYDPEIGRFISPDTIIPNYYNPQFLNRYSYCLNNPLKYTDPTGHDLTVINSGRTNIYDEIIYDVYDGDTWVGSGGDWDGVRSVYEVYCSINDLSDGCTVKYDYESDYGTYPVYLVSNSSTMGNIMGKMGAGGISLNSAGLYFGGTGAGIDGIFIRWDDYKNVLNSEMPYLLEHESQHYFEQSISGFWLWTAAYYGEMGLKWAWYGGDYWKTTYNMNSFEIRARVKGERDPNPYGITTTNWRDSYW